MVRRKRGKTHSAAELTAFAALWGLICTVVCCVLFASLIRFVLGDMHFARFLGSAAVCTGGCAGGYTAGKLRRRRGLVSGIACAGLMYIAGSAAELILFRHILSAKELLLLVLAGAAGGVFGVNSRRPGWLRDQ